MSFDDEKKIFSPVGVFDFHFHELVNTYENTVAQGDVTRKDSQRRYLAQQSVAILEQCSSHSNNVATMM